MKCRSKLVCVLSKWISATLPQCLGGSYSSKARLQVSPNLKQRNKDSSKCRPKISKQTCDVCTNRRNLPSMTAYCRASPGVAFNRFLSFPSIVKCGAFWKQRSKQKQFIHAAAACAKNQGYMDFYNRVRIKLNKNMTIKQNILFYCVFSFVVWTI